MIIKSVHVKNFRSIYDDSLELDYLTAIVGRNGAGKSSFLRALELFYEPSSKIVPEDFYAEDTSREIEIAVTYSNLSTDESTLFSPYLDNNTLTVVRIFCFNQKSGTYHGMRLQNPDFVEIRNAGGKTEIRAKYSEIRGSGTYSILPSVKSADQALDEIQKWEIQNPASCTRMRDDGQFFGFTGVGQGYLGRYTKFIRIPAVRDASEDAIEKKGSCVTEMMDLVVRSVLASRADVVKFKENTQAEYRNIMDPAKLTELKTLESQLSTTLQYYTPDASVSLNWAELVDINVPMPEARVKLLEDGYESSVHRTGHGLQRAFILTMLQHLVAAKDMQNATEQGYASEEEIPEPDEPHVPSLVLAIEEPELYQHPSRQRHMASVLFKLAHGHIPGVAKKTQVVYTTHAPLFVGLDRFDQIRLLRKIDLEPDKPKITKGTTTSLDAVAEVLWNLDGQRGEKYTAATLRPRLQSIMTPWMNEGFFADAIVLVEGEGDRAAVLSAAHALNFDFESKGICVIPCIGKNNLDRPAIIFQRLGIRTYLLWDNDKGDKEANPADNKRLLRFLGVTEEDWPAGIWETHACFDCKLEAVLINEINREKFDYHLDKAISNFRIKKTNALKNPFVVQSVITGCYSEGHQSVTLSNIAQKIWAICNGN